MLLGVGADPSVDLIDQAGLVDDARDDAQVIYVLYFYPWSLTRFVHGSTKYLSVSSYLRNVS